MGYKEKYYRFNYLMYVPNKDPKPGVGYMRRRSFNPNIAKLYVRTKVLMGVGDVSLLDHIEIEKEEYDLHMRD